jgi:hypothetical protein
LGRVRHPGDSSNDGGRRRPLVDRPAGRGQSTGMPRGARATACDHCETATTLRPCTARVGARSPGARRRGVPASTGFGFSGAVRTRGQGTSPAARPGAGAGAIDDMQRCRCACAGGKEGGSADGPGVDLTRAELVDEGQATGAGTAAGAHRPPGAGTSKCHEPRVAALTASGDRR